MSTQEDAVVIPIDEDVNGDKTAPGRVPSTKDLCTKLHAVLLSAENKLWSQQELIGFKVIPNDDTSTLMKVLPLLEKQKKVTAHVRNGRPLWKVTLPEHAARYKGLNQDETIVYNYIENAGTAAIWTLHIVRRSGLTRDQVQKAVTKLLSKDLVKPVTNVQHPTRKYYILKELTPDEKLTGGAFYDNGILQEDMVYFLAAAAYKFIESKSWDFSSRKTKKSGRAPTAEEAHGMRAEAMRIPDGHRSAEPLLLPPGYTGYATVKDVMKALNNQGIAKAMLGPGDVGKLIDILCWDGRVVKVFGGKAFKSVKSLREGFEPGTNTNGLTEIPCGRCPVFDWCEENGPVNARTCTYFADWLVS